jgi:xylulokinase
MDKRGLPYAQKVNEIIGSQNYYRTAGHPLTYIGGASKVFWLENEAQDILSAGAKICPPETYFLSRLGCEELVCSDSTGTYLFPFEIEKKIWSEELACKLDFDLSRLPRLAQSTEIVGELSESAAEELGLVPGIPLVPGGGDGQCAAAGCGVVQSGLCMINIGTGTGVQTYLPEPLLDPGCVLNCAAHVVPDAWEMEGHTQCSGAVFRWLRDEFGAAELDMGRELNLDAFDLLIEEAIQAPPGSDGLLFLPTFNGSTAPVIDQEARGACLGLGLNHSRGHVIRALLEGVSLEIRWMLDAIQQSGAAINEVRLVGGGSKNPQWNQIHADILGRPVVTLHVTDSALVGAAMCAAVAVGCYKDFYEASNHFVRIKETIEPIPANVPLYEKVFENYRNAFTLLSESGIFGDLQG